MKKIVWILVLVFVLGTAIIVSAAAGDNISYNFALTSGNYSYSSSRPNYTGKAAIYMANAALTNIQSYTLSLGGKWTGPEPLSTGDSATYSSVTKYTSEGVKAAFIKYNFNGTCHIDGRFYYDGGF